MMRGRGGGHWGGTEPDLSRRADTGGRTFRRIVGFFRPYQGRLTVIGVAILVTASTLWTIYGFVIHDWAVILTNIGMVTLNGAIAVAKLRFG